MNTSMSGNRRYAALPDEERITWIKADRWIGFRTG